MKINTFVKLIVGLFVVADQSLGEREQRNNYNILVPDDQDLTAILNNVPQVLNLNSINLYEVAKNVTTLALTEVEAKAIEKLLQPYNGIIEPDYIYEADVTVLNNTQIISTVPDCKVPIYGEDIVIMGTKIYPNQKALKNYNVTVIFDSYNVAACNTHETKVAEVVTKVISGGDIQFLNAVSADCTGRSMLSMINGATNAAIQYKQKYGKNRRMTINISSTGPASMILNSIFANAVKAGIRVVTAAGNSAQDANGYSPANLGCTVAESIGSTNGQIPASFTNYGECVDVFVPGCITLFNPQTLSSSMSCGTSYSSPLQAARGLIQRFYFPQDTPAQTKFKLKTNTITIPVPTGSSFSGTMRALNADLACPKNTNPNIFTGIVPLNQWLALAPPNLCVKFTPSSKGGAIFIKFIDNKSEVCTVTLSGRSEGRSDFAHSIQCGNTTLAKTYTKGAIIPKNGKQITISQKENQFLVSFRNRNRDQTLIASKSIGNRTAIAFDKKGTASIKNALHCKM